MKKKNMHFFANTTYYDVFSKILYLKLQSLLLKVRTRIYPKMFENIDVQIKFHKHFRTSTI